MRGPQSDLVFASFNQGKHKEICFALNPLGITVHSPETWVAEGPQETGTTFHDNALLKARYYTAFTNLPILSDDSGLMIESLGGFPGVRTSEYAQSCGGYAEAFKELELKLAGKSSKAAFVCVMIFLDTERIPHIFEGRVEGQLVFPPRGTGGFGYSPIFQPQQSLKTLAELTTAECGALNHRGQALRKITGFLKD